MDSTTGFKVLDAFVLTLDDLLFRDRLIDQLSRYKPFSRFRQLVDDSP